MDREEKLIFPNPHAILYNIQHVAKEIQITALISILVLLCPIALPITMAQAWHDETHLAIAKAAGYKKWYNAAGADIAKIKAGVAEERNHYSENQGMEYVTPERVMEQINRYNAADDAAGHLYGAIIASVRAYAKSKKEGKYPQYHLAYCGHYLGDLSQPQHNAALNGSIKDSHAINDGVVESEALQRINTIAKKMYPVTLHADHFEADLAKEIARIANLSRKLNDELLKDNRTLSPEEAYRQLGHSASLFRAVLDYLRLSGNI